MPGRDLVALLDQLDQLVDDRRRGCDVAGVAVEGEHVAAQVQVAVEAPAQRPQDGVLGARQLGGDGVVEGQLPTRQGTQLTHRRADPLAVGAAAELRHQRRHHLAHLPLLAGAGLGDRRVDQLRQLLVGELLGQVALDQLRLEALGGGLLGPPGALVGLGRLDPLLALALQHRDLVALAELGVLLERRRRSAAAPPARSRSRAFIAVRTSS